MSARRRLAKHLTLSITLVVAGYALVSGLWILLSDLLVEAVFTTPASRAWAQTAKGWAFVAVTTLLLWTVLRRLARLHHEATLGQLDAERQATDATHLLGALADASTDAIFVKDLLGHYQLFNRRAAQFLGRDATSVLGQDDRALFGDEQGRRIQENDRLVVQLDKPQVFEEIVDTASGSVVFLASKGPLHDAAGQLIGTFGISRDITEMVATRQRLTDSEQRYRLAAAGGHVWFWDLRAGSLEVPQAFWSRLGADAPEASAALERLQSLTHPADLPARQATLRAHLRDGTPFALDLRLRHADGSWRWFHTQGLAMRGTDGRATAMAGTSFDVTRRKQAQEASALIGQRLVHLLDTMGDGFVSLDTQWRYVTVNKRAGEMFGRDPASLVGKHIWTEFPEGVGQPFYEVYHRAMREQQPCQFEEYYAPWRRWFENRIHPTTDGLSIFFTDVTERHQAEARLRRDEQRFRLAAASGQVWEWDFGAGQLTPSAEFFTHLGYPPVATADMLAAFESIVPPDDMQAIRRKVLRHIRREGPYRVQFRARDATGQERWFETQGQALWNDQGRAIYMAGTTFDITARRNAEQALIDSQADLFALSQQLLVQERDTNLRLAQSLHDRLGQSLGSARLYLDLARGALADDPGRTHPALQRLSQVLDTAIAEVRTTLVALRPPMLDTAGLASALGTELTDFNSGDLGTALRLDVAPTVQSLRWPDAVEYAAFMVAREAVTNALRHAQARQVVVHIDGNTSRLDLRITDDGIGIVGHHAQGRPGHLGIVGMRERALGCGARLTVAPGPAGGTVVQMVWHRDAP